MAARFWVGGTGNWDAATTTNWSATSGGAGGASVPTSADTVTFDSLSNATAYTVTVTATANCSDISFTNPLTGALTFAGSSALNVFGNFTISSAITRTYTGTITFSATATGKTITMNSIALGGPVTFSGVGGGWTLQDDFNTGASTITLTSGILDTNGKAVTTTGTFTISGSLTRTLTLGASTLSCSSWSATTTTNLTFNPNTSTISQNAGGGSFSGGGLTYNNVILTQSSTLTWSGANTYANLTLTGGAVKTATFPINNNTQTVTGTFTANGNSSVNRILISSVTVGGQSTINAAVVSITNADFQDIIGAGAGSWNLSAISGGSGDCGGNSGITFTAGTTQHWLDAAVSRIWSSVANWTSRVPLPQDDVVMDFAFGTSQTVTLDMPRAGKSIDWTGATWTTALTWTWQSSGSTSCFGSLTLISGLTLGSGSQPMTFRGRSSYTIDTKSILLPFSIALNAPTGTLTLASDFTIGSTRSLTVANGTFTAVNGGNNYIISVGTIVSTGSAANAALTLGSATHFITGTGDLLTSTNVFTLNVGTSTIKVTDTSNTAITFGFGSGATFNNVWFSRGASTGSITIRQSNTFNDFKDDGTAAHSIIFTAGTTTTVRSFSVRGNGVGNEITIDSTTTSTHALVFNGGTPISCDYLNIQHSVATPSATWYAGNNSINNQATASAGSGWIFNNYLTKQTFQNFLRPRIFGPGLAR